MSLGFTEADRLRESVVTRRIIGGARVKCGGFSRTEFHQGRRRVQIYLVISINRGKFSSTPSNLSSSLESFHSFIKIQNSSFP